MAYPAATALAATLLPEVMARYAAQYPGVQLELHDTLSGPAFDLVAAGKVDFAITAANLGSPPCASIWMPPRPPRLSEPDHEPPSARRRFSWRCPHP